jgi:hypothetical protein
VMRAPRVLSTLDPPDSPGQRRAARPGRPPRFPRGILERGMQGVARPSDSALHQGTKRRRRHLRLRTWLFRSAVLAAFVLTALGNVKA